MAATIVTGVDDTETAAMAARTAARLAVALDARLHVLSAYGKFESGSVTSGSETIRFNTEKQASRTASAVVADLRAEFPRLKVTSGPAEGRPWEALVNAAKELDASLIVVGNKRVQGFGRVLGSIARDVAAHAPCDVYIAHTHQRG